MDREARTGGPDLRLWRQRVTLNGARQAQVALLACQAPLELHDVTVPVPGREGRQNSRYLLVCPALLANNNPADQTRTE